MDLCINAVVFGRKCEIPVSLLYGCGMHGVLSRINAQHGVKQKDRLAVIINGSGECEAWFNGKLADSAVGIEAVKNLVHSIESEGQE